MKHLRERDARAESKRESASGGVTRRKRGRSWRRVGWVLLVLVVIGAIALIVRGRDVRFVLLLASLTIALVTDLSVGHWQALAVVVREFVATFSNETE